MERRRASGLNVDALCGVSKGLTAFGRLVMSGVVQ